MSGRARLQASERMARWWHKIISPAVVILFASSGPVWAGGSISLSEVLDRTKSAKELGLQVDRSLASTDTAVDEVTCGATRVGRHFEKLGGLRVAPYECAIGKRILEVRSNVRIFDKDGVELAIGDPRSLRRAAILKEEDFQWEWRDAQ